MFQPGTQLLLLRCCCVNLRALKLPLGFGLRNMEMRFEKLPENVQTRSTTTNNDDDDDDKYVGDNKPLPPEVLRLERRGGKLVRFEGVVSCANDHEIRLKLLRMASNIGILGIIKVSAVWK